MIVCPDIQSLALKSFRPDIEHQLTLQLERRLKSVNMRPVRVCICKNELQLFGNTESWHEKQLVQEAVRTLAPAYRIRNELRVSLVPEKPCESHPENL